MYAIEFRTKIKNGIIEVPKDYWERLRQETRDEQVRVILLTSERAETREADVETDLIEQLLTTPLRISEFTPLSRDEAHERSRTT
jgi:hypothetical protein